MKRTRTRLFTRLALSALLASFLVGPAAATPGNGHGKGNAAEAHGLGKQGAKGGRGKAVRTAAKCPIHGKAKGKLVSSIAKDKDATVEDAIEACAKALEQQNETDPEEDVELENDAETEELD